MKSTGGFKQRAVSPCTLQIDICHLSERLPFRVGRSRRRGSRRWRPHGHGAPELSLGVLDLAAADIDVLDAAAVAAAAAEPLPAAVSARSVFVG